MTNISIIIPVFNAQDYLERTVESIIKQEFKNIEIIFVNDGSTDNSLKVLKKISNKYSNVKVYTQSNKGVSSARNLGLKQSTGEYIMFLDADDYLEKNALKKMYNVIIEKNSDICLGLTHVIGNYKNKCDIKHNYFEESGKFIENNSIDILVDLLKNDSIFDLHSACAKLYKRDIINNIYFADGRSSNEDRYYLFRALCNSKKCVCLYDIVYLYEKHINSLSNKKIDMRIMDNIFFSEEMLKFIKNNIPELTKEAEYNNLLTYMKVYRNIYRSDRKTIKKFSAILKNIKKYILQNYKNVNLSKDKVFEIIILSKFSFLYKFLLLIYDLGR